MSERPMAQRHEWPETVIGTELLYRVCRSGPEVLFEVEQNGNRAQAQAFLNACRELLRVVAERDEARRQLQERRFAHEADNARLVQERDQARLEHKCSEATLAMAVARLGGKVEGHPTHRINFLQRIDELRRIEGELAAAEARGAARATEQCRRLAKELMVREDGYANQIVSPISAAQKHRFGAALIEELLASLPAAPDLAEEDAHSEETGERCRAEDGRDALGKALLKIRIRAARSIAGSGPRTAERRLAEDVQECALDALRDAGLLPEEDGAPTGRQEDRERP